MLNAFNGDLKKDLQALDSTDAAVCAKYRPFRGLTGKIKTNVAPKKNHVAATCCSGSVKIKMLKGRGDGV